MDVFEPDEAARREVVSGLRSLGLSTYGASTFQSLVAHSEMTAAELCQETGIPDSKIYHALRELEEAGMIAVQRGRPNAYRALRPEEAMESLGKALEEEYELRRSRLEGLTGRLQDIYESVEERDEVEVAYIIRGARGIMRKMRGLMGQARRSLLVFIPDQDIMKSLKESMIEAAERGVRVELALKEGVEADPGLWGLSRIRSMDCNCCLLVADGEAMLNVPDWSPEGAVAVLTRESNMILFTQEYYNNPTCCTGANQKA